MTLIPRIAELLVDDPVADEALHQRIVLHLSSCRPELRGLNVTVRSGVVLLGGELPTFFLRQLALERARRVAGVRRLVDQIVVPALLSRFRRPPK